MIKTIKYLLLFSPVLFASFECSDSVTNPPNYPPGYQYDIPWPSLADSPWPMYRGNPQSTGRSKENLNIQGIVEWEYTNLGGQLNSSIVIDKDSNIHVPFHFGSSWGGLHILNRHGILNKILDSNIFCGTTPIIAADGSFYNWSQSNGITCYNPDKTVRWFYQVNSTARTSNLNIGLDGTIYFLDNHTLYALGKDGALRWSLQNEKFSTWPYALTTFSPDGKTLYIPGEYNKAAIYALDITTKTIKWEFGKGRSYWSVVDCYGNIYISTNVDTVNSGKLGLFSITSEGSIRWYFEHEQTVYPPGFSFLEQITIDANGNIFFVSDSIHSLDYLGKIRWKKRFIPVDVSAPLTCDNSGNIYLTYTVTGNEMYLIKIDNSGIQVFDVALNKDPGNSPALGYNRIYVPSGKRDVIYSIK